MKTAETVTRYLAKARQLYLKAEEALPKGGILTHMYVVHWTYSRVKEGELRANTWRLYKAALICHLEQLYEDADAKEALNEIKGMANDGKRKNYRLENAGGKKLKVLTPEMEFKFFEEHLKNRVTSKNIALRDWLIATLNTGARPCEWENAKLIENDAFVRFTNAKSTNGRSHGKFRTVPISHLDYDILMTIKAHMDRVRTYMLDNGNYSTLKKRMENGVTYESKKCFPRYKKQICLYTMRHQFAANCKKSGLTKTEVAAIMGHGVADTADRHYARAGVGHVIDGLKGVPEEAARVRDGKPNPFLRNPNARNTKPSQQTNEGASS